MYCSYDIANSTHPVPTIEALTILLSICTAHITSANSTHPVPTIEALAILLSICTAHITSANSTHPVPTIEALTILLSICTAHAHVSGRPRLSVPFSSLYNGLTVQICQ